MVNVPGAIQTIGDVAVPDKGTVQGAPGVGPAAQAARGREYTDWNCETQRQIHHTRIWDRPVAGQSWTKVRGLERITTV